MEPVEPLGPVEPAAISGVVQFARLCFYKASTLNRTGASTQQLLLLRYGTTGIALLSFSLSRTRNTCLYTPRMPPVEAARVAVGWRPWGSRQILQLWVVSRVTRRGLLVGGWLPQPMPPRARGGRGKVETMRQMLKRAQRLEQRQTHPCSLAEPPVVRRLLRRRQ